MDIKIENIVKNGRVKPYLSKFLTIAEQAEIEKFSNELNINFSNTYPDEERRRAFVSLKDMSITPDFKISFLKIISKTKLPHPDILGAILSLGLDREVIGDIITCEQIVICTEDIANYIISNLNIINKHSVEIKLIEDFNYLGNNNYIEKQIIVSSLRIDGILAKSLNLSRTISQDLISKRMVRVNGNTLTKCDYLCIESDIISITRNGRIKILDVTRKTKKDKLVLNILLIKI